MSSRTFYAPIYGDEDYVQEIYERVLNQCHGKTITTKVREIFLLGLEEIERRDGQPDSLLAEMKDIHNDDIRLQRLRKVWKKRGDQGFIDWCAHNNTDPNEVMVYSLQMDTKRHYQFWLDEIMSDDSEYEIGVIKSLAFEQGIATTETEWHRLECYASRQGYTKNCAHGNWKRNKF
jgi:hypothetical protein